MNIARGDGARRRVGLIFASLCVLFNRNITGVRATHKGRLAIAVKMQ